MDSLHTNANGDFDDGDMDLRTVLLRMWAGRWWLLSATCVFAGVFALVAFFMTPVYRATVVLVPASSEGAGSLSSALGSLSSLAAIAGISVGAKGGDQKEEALAVMRSRAFTEAFIIERNMLRDLYARKWNAAKGTWLVAPDKQPTLAEASKYFQSLLKISVDSKTGLVTVQLDWRDPQQVSLWCNDFVARLNSVMRHRSIEKTEAYLSYLEKELAVTSSIETRGAIGRLMEAQINQRMLAKVTEEFAFRVVDKALVPDLKDPEKPRKILMTLLGAVLGGIVGCLLVLVVIPLRRQLHANAV